MTPAGDAPTLAGMPLAEARYDVVLRDGDRLVPVVIDMIETRDVGPDDAFGRLRDARMVRYDTPDGAALSHSVYWIDGRWRARLDFKGVVQESVEWDRRYLRWID